MKHMVRMHRHLDAPQELILVKLLVQMGSAAIAATASLYLQSLGLSDSAIGIATGVVLAINLAFILILPRIMEKYSLTKILMGSIAGFAISLVIFGSVKNAFIALTVYGLTRLLITAFTAANSILFHDDSPSEESFKKNQALAGSIGNFSWMAAPFIASLIVVQYSFFFLYIISAVIVLLGLTILKLQKIPEPIKKHQPYAKIAANIRYYFSKKHLRDAYMINASVVIWWVFIFTFVTIFMKESGFSTGAIGAFLTFTQLPLFLLEFKTNKLVDRFRYRVPLVVSHSLLAIIMLILAIFGLHTITLGLIIVGSLAIVYLEPVREMYLYEKIEMKDEEKIQPIFLTAETLASMLLRIMVGALLIFAPQNVTYLLIAIVMAIFAWHSRTIVD